MLSQITNLISMKHFSFLNSVYLSFLLLLFGCGQKQASVTFDRQIYSVAFSDTLVQDSIAIRMIDNYRSKFSEEMNVIIGNSSQLLQRGRPESLLTNFVADLIYNNASKYAQTIRHDIVPDMSLVNVSGFRNAIPKGVITRQTIFEVMPFDNRMVFVYLKADVFAELCEAIAQKGGEGVAGITMAIKGKHLKHVLVGGEAIKDSKTYCVVTIDYLADGGGGFGVFAKADSIVRTSVDMREAIIDEVIELNNLNRSISVNLDRRIYVE